MTNSEIIISAMESVGLDPRKTMVNTFSGWSRHNYRVKSGEKAAFKAKIWKPVSRDKDGEEEKKLILVTASFFTREQVEKRQAEVRLYADK